MKQNRLELYNKLVAKYGEKCYICGRRDVMLEIDRLIPQSAGGTSDISNLRLICREDNVKKSNKFFSEVEYIEYLKSIILKNKRFRNPQLEVALSDSRYMADLIVERKVGNKWEKLLIEAKVIPTFTELRLREVIEQLKLFKKYAKNHKIAFAFPGILPDTDNALLQKEGIEVWDINHISTTFAKEIATTQHSLFQALFVSTNYVAVHDKLIIGLKKINPGKKNKDWSKYQKHIEKILDYLFGSVLSSPITEHSDHFKVNFKEPCGSWILGSHQN
jgi:hypothetical protein